MYAEKLRLDGRVAVVTDGTQVLVQPCVRRNMLKTGKGAIVNPGSISGIISNRPQKQTYYIAAKAAMHQLTSSLATEWADQGVRVSAVAPIHVVTEMTSYHTTNDMIDVWLRDTPTRRIGQVKEFAFVAHLLASDPSSLMTETTVAANAVSTR